MVLSWTNSRVTQLGVAWYQESNEEGLVSRNLSLAKRGVLNYYLKRPFSVSFEITHSCNATCKHCHLRGMIKDEVQASPERLGEICRTLMPVVAQISGGEPLLRRDVEDIVRAFRQGQKAPIVAMTTNAALLKRKRYDSLREAGMDEFSISLDYPDERHDEFRGIPRLFSRIVDLARELRHEPNKGLLLCCVIQSDNYRDLVKMAELAQDLAVKINFSTYTAERTQDRSYLLSSEQVDELEQEIIPKLLALREKNLNVMTSAHAFEQMLAYFRGAKFSNCGAGWKFVNVNPDGTFSPCGLRIRDFSSREELIEKFSKANQCEDCYTSIRANCEKPAWQMLGDNLVMLKMRAKANASARVVAEA